MSGLFAVQGTGVTLVSDSNNFECCILGMEFSTWVVGHGQYWSALIGPFVRHASTESEGLLIMSS